MERTIRSTCLLTLTFYLVSVTSTYRIHRGTLEDLLDDNQPMGNIPEIRTLRREGTYYRTGDGSRAQTVGVGDDLVHDVLRLAEYKNLRHAFLTLLQQVSKEELAIEEKYFSLLEQLRAEDSDVNSEMSPYSDYQSINLAGNPEKRSHRKRSAFDSIGHSGDFTTIGDRFSGPPSSRSREFTFENLLPLLLRMQREKRFIS